MYTGAIDGLVTLAYMLSKEVPAAFFWDQPTLEATEPSKYMWWTTFLPSYRQIDDASRLKIDTSPASGCPRAFAAGVEYRTFALNPPLYMRFLQSRCSELGARIFTGEFESPEACCDSLRQYSTRLGILPPSALVNCTGLGALTFVRDTAVFPTRGQLVVVKGRAHRIVTRARDGWEALVIPRPGAGLSSEGQTVLGGCKIPGDW